MGRVRTDGGWTGRRKAGIQKFRRMEVVALRQAGRTDYPLMERITRALEYLKARARRQENGGNG